LRENDLDGSAADRIAIEKVEPSLEKKFDPEAYLGLGADVDSVKSVRDKLHQDRLGARENIDWCVFVRQGVHAGGARCDVCSERMSPRQVLWTGHLENRTSAARLSP
jgi:hypothetical protein